MVGTLPRIDFALPLWDWDVNPSDVERGSGWIIPMAAIRQFSISASVIEISSRIPIARCIWLDE
jgi:hypothetical protein